MIVRIQVRRGTSTEWANANPVLHSGEFGYERDTGKIKIGNGSSPWNNLSYLQGSGGGGADGLSAYQIAVNNGFVGTEQEWLISLRGADGVDGENGESAYDIAVNNGFVGTEQEWLESLSPVRYMDGDIFEGDGETPETKTTIKDGSIGEEKLSEEVRGMLDVVVNPTRKTALVIETDFYSSNSPFAQGFVGSAISGGGVQARVSTKEHLGIVALRDSTTSNGGFRIETANAAFVLAGKERVVSVFRLVSSRAGIQFRIGFQDTPSIDTPIDGAFFQYEGVTGLIEAKTINSNTQTVANTMFAPTVDIWYTSIIQVNDDATNVNFIIYNDLGENLWEENITTNIPTAANRATGCGIIATESSTDSAADMIEIDYFRLEINRELVR